MAGTKNRPSPVWGRLPLLDDTLAVSFDPPPEDPEVLSLARGDSCSRWGFSSFGSSSGVLLAGGISYTVGSILYGAASKKVHCYMHSVFHIFVVLGSILQYVSIIVYVI